jgi:hypothetical protein
MAIEICFSMCAQVSSFRLPASSFRLPAASFRLPASSFPLDEGHILTHDLPRAFNLRGVHTSRTGSCRFLQYSVGSCNEFESALILSRDVGSRQLQAGSW